MGGHHGGGRGAAVGDQAGFFAGRRYGQKLFDRLPAQFRRSGEVERAMSLVRRRGALSVVLGRWAAALRALVPGVAGMACMPQGLFTLANITGGALWATTVAVLGYVAGTLYRLLEQRLGAGSEVLLAVAVLALAVWVVRVRRSSARTAADALD